MTDDTNTKLGWIFKNSNSAVYMIPEAVKEFKKNIKGNNNLKRSYFSLIGTWLQSDSHPPNSICKKIIGREEELYELKKSGTQARLLGYYKEADFFVLKSLKKKTNKLEPDDIQTLKNRKQSFYKEGINWEEQDE